MQTEFVIQYPPEPAGYWSFDGSRNGTWFAAYSYPNKFHRWMHKVFFGITWKEKL